MNILVVCYCYIALHSFLPLHTMLLALTLACCTDSSIRSTAAATQLQPVVTAVEAPVFAHETAQYSALLDTLLHDAIKVNK
jgi:hypothetical protein